MDNVLIYLVNNIPSSGSFSTTELLYLQDSFQKIYVVTTNLDDVKKPHKFDSSKVKLFHLNLKTYRKDAVKSIFLVFTIAFWKDLWYSMGKKGATINYSSIIYSLRYLYLAKRTKSLLKSIVKNEKINLDKDRVVGYSFWGNEFGVGLSLFKARNNKISAFVKYHRYDLYNEEANFGIQPYRFLLSNIDSQLFIAKEGLDYFKENFRSIKIKQAKLIYLGSENFKSNSIFEHESNILLSLSNVVAVKNLELLVNALSACKLNLKWIHIGDGADFQKVKALAKEKLPKNINYEFLGRINQTEIINTLEKLKPTYLINVSKSEGLPVSMMEAMSGGIPVIGTDVGGVNEIVCHSKNGFLLSANPTTIEVLEAIENAFSVDVDKMERLRENARKTWETKFNAENCYKELVEVLLN